MYYKDSSGNLIPLGSTIASPIQEGLDPATGNNGTFFYDTDATDPSIAITQTQADGWYANRITTSTDNAITRFDGATGLIQNSGAKIDDSGNLSLLGGSGIRATVESNSTTSNDGASLYLTTVTPQSGQWAQIMFRVGSNNRWRIIRNNDSESGSNAGSNFEISRYSDAGSLIDSPITITRSTGNVAINGGTTDLGSTSRSLTINSGTSVAGAAAYSAVLASAEGRTLQMLVSNQNSVNSMGTRSNHPLNITTNDTARISIDSSGRVTLPSQPAFTARSAQATTQGNDVIWDTVDYQVGSNYNSTNGRFNAPVSGYYYFHAHGLWAQGDSGDRRIALYKNGSAFPGMRFISNKTVNVWQTWYVDGVVYMTVGDWATIRVEQSGAGLHTDNNYNQFSGYLLG